MKPEDKAKVQQALEAMQRIKSADGGGGFLNATQADQLEEAIIALRQLLERTEQGEVVVKSNGHVSPLLTHMMNKRTKAEAQPAPVQEPETCSNCANAVWPYSSCDGCTVQFDDPTTSNWEPITTPPAQPAVPWSPALESVWGEPDHGDELTIAYMSGVHTGKKISKREWVGLTDEEVDALMGSPNVGFSYRNQYAIAFAKVIDAKLREKNGGAAQPADHTEEYLDMVRALERLLVVQDELCSVDHHGYCQSHYLDNVNHHGGCRVANARALVAKVRGKL